MEYCDPHPEDSWLTQMQRTWFCGVSNVAGATVGEAGETVRSVAGEAGETARDVADPWNFLALGGGAAAGLTVPIVVVGGIAGVFAIDFFVNDGRATGAVVKGVGKLLATVA